MKIAGWCLDSEESFKLIEHAGATWCETQWFGNIQDGGGHIVAIHQHSPQAILRTNREIENNPFMPDSATFAENLRYTLRMIKFSKGIPQNKESIIRISPCGEILDIKSQPISIEPSRTGGDFNLGAFLRKNLPKLQYERGNDEIENDALIEAGLSLTALKQILQDGLEKLNPEDKNLQSYQDKKNGSLHL